MAVLHWRPATDGTMDRCNIQTGFAHLGAKLVEMLIQEFDGFSLVGPERGRHFVIAHAQLYM